MPTQNRKTRRDIIVTSVGMLLLVATFVGVALGATAYDESNSPLLAGANALLSVGVAGLAGLVGYYERTWQIWRFARSLVFLLLGGFFALGSILPCATEWLFAVLVEVL